MNKLKVFSTFTGVGSPEMALRNLGVAYESVGICEVDKSAIVAFDAIHNNGDTILEKTKIEMLKYVSDLNIFYNFSTGKNETPRSETELKKAYDASVRSNNYGDIRKIEVTSLPDFDLFTYSFPCKNISVAGTQAGLGKGSDTQSSLLWECERIIEYKKPKYLLMENVKNLVGVRHIQDFELWISTLKSLGYTSYWKVLNGKDFGVPQNRERVMMVSIFEEYDNGSFSMPKSTNSSVVLNDILESDVPDSMFMNPKRYEHFNGLLPSQEISYCIDANYHKGSSVEGYINKRRRQLIQVGLLDNKIHSNKRVYDPIGISPTLNSMNGGNRQPKILNNFRVRKLTPLECWRCMGFSDEDFKKVKSAGLSNSKLYERAGRGIVVPMLEEIFRNMLYV